MGPVYITVGKAAAQVIPHGIGFSRVHRSSMSTVSDTVVHSERPTYVLAAVHAVVFIFVFICV